MTKPKILIIALVGLLVCAYGAYTVAFPKPAVKAKVTGSVYVLPKQFTLNLKDGRYATLTAALVLAPGQSTGASADASSQPDGFGTLPEEAVIRDIITSLVTGHTTAALVDPASRERLKHQILMAIRQGTDVKVNSVLFTDLAVQ